jgi:hypothetical protein
MSTHANYVIASSHFQEHFSYSQQRPKNRIFLITKSVFVFVRLGPMPRRTEMFGKWWQVLHHMCWKLVPSISVEWFFCRFYNFLLLSHFLVKDIVHVTERVYWYILSWTFFKYSSCKYFRRIWINFTLLRYLRKMCKIRKMRVNWVQMKLFTHQITLNINRFVFEI